MKKSNKINNLSIGSTNEEQMIPLSKVHAISKEYENTIHKLMDLIQSRGMTNEQWGGSIDAIASSEFNQASIYLLDYENIGNFPALIHTWNKPTDLIYCFMNKTQVEHFDHEVKRLEPSLSHRIHPIVLSASGLNALDIAIGMFIGHISALYKPLGIHVYTQDRGYSVLMEICRFWGIQNIEIRQGICIGTVDKPKHHAMVKPKDDRVKPIPMVQPLVQPGKPIVPVKSKASKQQRKDQAVELMKLIKDKNWFDQPISQSLLIDHLMVMFPHSKENDLIKLISRLITYGFLSSKKGKFSLNINPNPSMDSMVKPSN